MAYDNQEKALLQELGERIRSLREEIGISQMELGFRSDLDRTYISSVERGKRNISVINLAAIAHALDVTIKDLFP